MTGGSPAFWADAVLIAHFAIAAFLVLGLPLIWIGAAAGWRFVRNPLFRWAHAGLMGFVLAETVAGKLCPLTVLEAALRRSAGDGGEEPASFVGYWLGRALFLDLDPAWFGIAYGLFFALIVLTLFLVPVRKPAKPAGPPAGGLIPTKGNKKVFLIKHGFCFLLRQPTRRRRICPLSNLLRRGPTLPVPPANA